MSHKIKSPQEHLAIIELQLKAQVLNLLEDLLAICPQDSPLLLARLYFENQIVPSALMDGFVKWVLPWREHIKTHNEEFFEKNDHIFGNLPIQKVNHFKTMMTDGTFGADDKKVIWEYFDVFVRLLEKHQEIHEKNK